MPGRMGLKKCSGNEFKVIVDMKVVPGGNFIHSSLQPPYFFGTYINHIVGWISLIVVAMFVGYLLDLFGIDVFIWRHFLI